MSFTEETRQQPVALWRAIDELPFNRELAAGTLSHERIGSSFESLLEAEGRLEDATQTASKRVLERRAAADVEAARRILRRAGGQEPEADDVPSGVQDEEKRAGSMSFTDEIWQQTQALRRAIDELPFNRELAAGTLSRERFKFYVIQDKLYLDQYARTLAIAGARAPDLGAMDKFVGSALGALAVERALHGQFLGQFGMSEAELALAEPSPTCLAYTNFLIAAAHHDSWPVLVAAILPCFWIYHDVGVRIAKETVPDNFYQPWIDTYADDAFAASVKDVIRITDAAAAGAGAAERAAMARAFVRSTQYEWMFWDSAYRLEGWPIGA